jgi:hypothetical protein
VEFSAVWRGAANIAGCARRTQREIPAIERKTSGAVLASYIAMSAYNAELHCMMSSPGPVGRAGAAVAVAPTSGGESGVGNFFNHVLDVVNPLQHLPVVGTLYRAITGDKIGAVEKIAGDTLYGGLWGAVGSVADVAFEAATGKDFGGTMLAMVTGNHDAPTVVADAGPHKDFGGRLWAMLTGSQDDAPVAVARVAAPVITTNVSLPLGELPALPTDIQVADSMPANPQIAALTASLTAKGVNAEMANRALYAYRRSMAMPQAPLLASIN